MKSTEGDGSRVIKNQTSTSTLLSQFDYTYDVEGQILAWTKNSPNLAAPQRYDLGYDNADQLLTAPLKNANTNALIKQYTYGYDPASNRTSERVANATTTSTPNNVNELVSQSGSTNRTLTYDLNGNLTNDGSSRTFEWDAANRLVAVNYTGATTRSEFTYDGLSRVVKVLEKNGANTTSTVKFVWCGMEKCEERSAGNAVTLQTFPQGQYASNTAYFYTRDHLGSIREMFKSDGTVVARSDYDPWGRFTAVQNMVKPNFNYTGLFRHSNSKLDFASYRAYDPDLGRWLSRDPIAEAGGLNLYAYVGNSAVSRIDPSGLYVNVPLADKSAYRAAWQYLITVPAMRQIFETVSGSDTRFIVRTNSADRNWFEDPIRTIHWDPHAAHDFPDGTLTPAMSIGHEFAHVALWDAGWAGWWEWFRGMHISDPIYDNLEERRVIQGPEAEAARLKCEALRKNHSKGTRRWVPWPTAR